MNKRLSSIDLLRGVVMILMAIDHVRVYSGIPAGGPDPAVFFTRWITHFCVPVFVFFAGMGAYLQGSKTGNKAALGRFLVIRGLLLVLLELTLLRFFWTFNLNFANFTLAGVIWMLGWCMVIMAAIVRLPTKAIAIIGLVIVFLQQAFGWLGKLLPASIRPVWEFLYPTGAGPWPAISILYTLVPWIGVMATGYAFGWVLQQEPVFRRRVCMRIGWTAIALFLVVGSAFLVWGPAPAHPLPPLLRLLNQTKYPASQLYLLMTLGPVIALLPAAERWGAKAAGDAKAGAGTAGTGIGAGLAKSLLVFGRVPLFFYLLHILLIHCSALLVNFLRTGMTHQEWYVTAPYDWIPEPQRWSLGLLYLVWLGDVLLLYFACRWYARYKGAHPEKKWLKFL
jgi:uncharacterized membrane protein